MHGVSLSMSSVAQQGFLTEGCSVGRHACVDGAGVRLSNTIYRLTAGRRCRTPPGPIVGTARGPLFQSRPGYRGGAPRF